MPERVLYAILALHRAEAEEVVGHLTAKKKDTAAAWLSDNKDALYGDAAEDWKPFLRRRPLQQLVSENNGAYLLQKEVFRLLDDDAGNYEGYADANIRLFFIDPFLTCLPKYRLLAKSLDLFLCEGKMRRCCFAVYPGFPDEVRRDLKTEREQAWRAVFRLLPRGAQNEVLNDPNAIRQKLNSVWKDLARTMAHPDALVAAEHAMPGGPKSLDRVSLG